MGCRNSQTFYIPSSTGIIDFTSSCVTDPFVMVLENILYALLSAFLRIKYDNMFVMLLEKALF